MTGGISSHSTTAGAPNGMNEFKKIWRRWRAVRTEKIEELLLAWLHQVLKHTGFSHLSRTSRLQSRKKMRKSGSCHHDSTKMRKHIVISLGGTPPIPQLVLQTGMNEFEKNDWCRWWDLRRWFQKSPPWQREFSIWNYLPAKLIRGKANDEYISAGTYLEQWGLSHSKKNNPFECLKP